MATGDFDDSSGYTLTDRLLAVPRWMTRRLVVLLFGGALMLGVVALAGCGGDAGDDQPRAETTPTTTAQAPENPYFEKVVDDLDALADAVEGKCRNSHEIRRRLARLEAHADHLPFDAKVVPVVQEVADDTQEALSSCREKRELERAADEANEAAEEFDQLGEEP